MTQSGIEPATFRVVAQCLNQTAQSFGGENIKGRTIWNI